MLTLDVKQFGPLKSLFLLPDLGHLPPPLDFQLFNFPGHFRAAQTLTLDPM